MEHWDPRLHSLKANNFFVYEKLNGYIYMRFGWPLYDFIVYCSLDDLDDAV
jgi:hypothetical protein